MSYIVKLDQDAADHLVALILRDTIEHDTIESEPELLAALIEVHNYFSVPDQHIQLSDEEPEAERKGSFTEEEDDYLRWAHEQKLGIEEMAATLGRPYGTVGYRRYQLGLKYHRWVNRTFKEDS